MAFRVNTRGLGEKAAAPSPLLDSMRKFAESAKLFTRTFEKINGLLDQTARDQQRQKVFDQAKTAARQSPLQSLANLFGLGGGGKIGNFLAKAGGTLSGIGDTIGGGAGKFLVKAGNFLGGAAAGPVGVAIGVAAALAPVVKSLASAPFKAVAGGMETVNKALAGLNGKLGPIGSILGGATDGLDKFADKMKFINPVISGVAEGMSAVIKQFQAFLSIAVDLSQKASPGTVRRFTIAVEDTAAVVGHRLVPLVELMRDVVRGIGDFLQTALPSRGTVSEIFAPLRETVADLKDAVAPIAPIVKQFLIANLKLLAVNLRAIGILIQAALGPITAAARALGGGGGLQTSVGAAARSASYTTPEDYARSVQLAALTSEGIQGPAEQTAQNTETMVDLLRDIRTGFLGQAAAPVHAAAEAAAGWLGFRGGR